MKKPSENKLILATWLYVACLVGVLFITSWLAGCATVKKPFTEVKTVTVNVPVPFEVKVPVPVPCKAAAVQRPAFPFDQARREMPVDKKTALLAADRETRKNYEGKLEVTLKACQ